MWDVDNWAKREAGGFGVTLGQHVVGQAEILEVGRAVLSTQDGGIGGPQALGSHPTGAPCPPGFSPDVHEVFIHAPRCLGRHGHWDPVFLPREREREWASLWGEPGPAGAGSCGDQPQQHKGTAHGHQQGSTEQGGHLCP